MSGMVILGGIVSAALLVYLVAVLLQPEKFS
jgi:K+-transporting ATPase KdpF subunit